MSIQDFIHKGYQFVCDLEPDHDSGPPWANYDGMGVVSGWRGKYSKRPHERILTKERNSCRFYDWNASMKKALSQGWQPSFHKHARKSEFEFNLWKAGLTKRQLAHMAVEQDFDRLRDWCMDRWSYVGVVVSNFDTGETESVWGVESDAYDHIDELKVELAEEIISRISKTNPIPERSEATSNV